MSFNGFSTKGIQFLKTLGGKDKAWFDENRNAYQADVAVPAKQFVEALGAALNARISPGIVAQPKTNGSIAPINNDLRFNPDGAPYKDHLMFRFWEGANKKLAPTLYVRVHPTDGIGFAAGLQFDDVGRWREAVDKNGAQLAAALEALGTGRKLDVVGQALKRVPKPYPEDHPQADLLRHKTFQVRWRGGAAGQAKKPGFVDWCVDELDRAAGVHRWLVDAFG